MAKRSKRYHVCVPLCFHYPPDDGKGWPEPEFEQSDAVFAARVSHTLITSKTNSNSKRTLGWIYLGALPSNPYSDMTYDELLADLGNGG